MHSLECVHCSWEGADSKHAVIDEERGRIRTAMVFHERSQSEFLSEHTYTKLLFRYVRTYWCLWNNALTSYKLTTESCTMVFTLHDALTIWTEANIKASQTSFQEPPSSLIILSPHLTHTKKYRDFLSLLYDSSVPEQSALGLSRSQFAYRYCINWAQIRDSASQRIGLMMI